MRYPTRAAGPVFAGCLILCVLSGTTGFAAASGRSFDGFVPERVQRAALTRDGRHVAFGLREGNDLVALVYSVNSLLRPARLRTSVPLGSRWEHLAWVTNDRLVAVVGELGVLVVDLDGQVRHQLENAALAPPRQKRSGRPVVRALGPTQAPDEWLMQVHWSANSENVILDVIALNVRTFERRLVASRRVDSVQSTWLVDPAGRPRVLVEASTRRRRFWHEPADADGREAKGGWLDELVSKNEAAAWQTTPANLLAERAWPVGFGREPDVLYFASNLGRDTVGVYALDVRTGRRTKFAVADSALDLVGPSLTDGGNGLVFDRAQGGLVGIVRDGTPRFVRWLDADLAAAQDTIAACFPERDVRLLEWDDARTRFLVQAIAPHDDGRWFVVHREDRRCVEFQRNPAPPLPEAPRVEPLNFASVDGAMISGRVIWPAPSAGLAPGAVIWIQDPLTPPATPPLPPEVRALVGDGFAIVHINYRGTAGFGRARLQQLRGAFEAVPIEDAIAALGALQARVDPARVVIAGQGFGGYVALHAIQQHPESFRAAFVINGPLELDARSRQERNAADFQRMAEARFAASGASAARQEAAQALGGSPEGSSPGSEGVTITPPAAEVTSPMGSAEQFESEAARWFYAPAKRHAREVQEEADKISRPVLSLHDPRQPDPGLVDRRRLFVHLQKTGRPAIWFEPSSRRSGDPAQAAASRHEAIAAFLEQHLSPATTAAKAE